MNKVQISGVNYIVSNEEIATFLNQEVYSDMIWSEEMDVITSEDDVFALLCETINDEPMFGESLLEFLNDCIWLKKLKNFIISLDNLIVDWYNEINQKKEKESRNQNERKSNSKSE